METFDSANKQIQFTGLPDFKRQGRPSSKGWVMTNKENFYFTAKCLTLNEHPPFREEIIQAIASNTINWERFVGFCSNHLILPVIYLKFKAHHILPSLPTELAEYLKEIHALNASRNVEIKAQLNEILHMLNAQGIYPTVLKGAGNLADQHKVIHNFIHSQLSHRGNADGIVSLKDLYDLYLLSKRVSIASSLPSIQYKRKAIAYFVFTGKALGLQKKFYVRETLSSRLFCLKHDLNQSSVLFYQTYRSFRYLFEKIILGYSQQVIQSFYCKEIRQSVIARLSNPHWYKNHLDSYIHFFSGNQQRQANQPFL